MGEKLVEVLLDTGASVTGIDHNTERMEALARKFTGRPFDPVVADLLDENLEKRLCAALPEEEPIGGLVNLAAVSCGDVIENLTDTDWDRSLATNVTAAMRLIRLLSPRMIKHGGSIVNVGSPVGLIGARKPSYAASKAALVGLTMSCAKNLGHQNIRVNLFLPGPTITRMTEDWSEEKRRAIATESFLGRLCQPVEVARTIRFLLSPDSSYITGSIVDGTAGSMFGH